MLPPPSELQHEAAFSHDGLMHFKLAAGQGLAQRLPGWPDGFSVRGEQLLMPVPLDL